MKNKEIIREKMFSLFFISAYNKVLTDNYLEVRNLLDFLNRYSYWLLFILLEVLSLMLLFRFNTYQGSVWFTSANTLSGKILEYEQNLLSYINLGEQNRILVRKNFILERRVDALSRKLQEATHEQSYSEERQQEILSDFSVIEAQVVNNSINKKNNYITINKGEADGVRPEMGVIAETGIIGMVYLTSKNYSIVMPLLNKNSNISCRLRGTNYFGYLQWDGSHPLYAYLGDVPRHAPVKVGMAVETSGYSAVFPEGIFVGKITKIENSEDGLSYRLRVNLSVDFSNVRNVLVLSTPNRVEIDSLQQKIEMEK